MHMHICMHMHMHICMHMHMHMHMDNRQYIEHARAYAHAFGGVCDLRLISTYLRAEPGAAPRAYLRDGSSEQKRGPLLRKRLVAHTLSILILSCKQLQIRSAIRKVSVRQLFVGN